jgi:hypothetical protein
MGATQGSGRQSGQASISFLAVVPLALVCALACAQLAVVGYALHSAGAAARAAARAIEVGQAAEPAARGALLPVLRRGVRVREREAEARVEVRAPSLFPGLPRPRVAAASALDADPPRGAGRDG